MDTNVFWMTEKSTDKEVADVEGGGFCAPEREGAVDHELDEFE